MSLACESKLTLHYIAHPASAHVSKSKIRRHLKSEVRTVPDYIRGAREQPRIQLSHPRERRAHRAVCAGLARTREAPLLLQELFDREAARGKPRFRLQAHVAVANLLARLDLVARDEELNTVL